VSCCECGDEPSGTCATELVNNNSGSNKNLSINGTRRLKAANIKFHYWPF
jgi:hypothetical protein